MAACRRVCDHEHAHALRRLPTVHPPRAAVSLHNGPVVEAAGHLAWLHLHLRTDRHAAALLQCIAHGRCPSQATHGPRKHLEDAAAVVGAVCGIGWGRGLCGVLVSRRWVTGLRVFGRLARQLVERHVGL